LDTPKERRKVENTALGSLNKNDKKKAGAHRAKQSEGVDGSA
jgi:hypothetical protein